MEATERVLFTNKAGRVECHACGRHSDRVFIVKCRGEWDPWVSYLCQSCIDRGMPRGATHRDVGELLQAATYNGPVKVDC